MPGGARQVMPADLKALSAAEKTVKLNYLSNYPDAGLRQALFR
jgi:hypothetical protein